MNRAFLLVLLAAALSGCTNDPSVSHHGGPPPKDPVDYHGVPTDVTPPKITEVPDAPRAASQAKSQTAPQ
ncbi:hypothetical protein [Paraburkholderia sp.]|uniref:hypothetical protein n=1 Tax=Paraburkholderia sp. TaxID=1926495 RepID=UPI00239BF421|nr:hypothetical protein [Paraburkholderia sp.]MDE1183741.1 hypothetical protein [Paraburkholderia sp.]